ncbi:uncharacterized protein LOC108253345 [Diaphorina citri]|uniref:Uncharacterized protein LOC108253345 n=1 Tax=Diaphorina citri TaxID=121845 RepID=A0A3Q0JCW4_DIACI|nr:uncharacterized protein LOC108253345 [Diaphorina citri]
MMPIRRKVTRRNKRILNSIADLQVVLEASPEDPAGLIHSNEVVSLIVVPPSDPDESVVIVGEANEGSRKRQKKESPRVNKKREKYAAPAGSHTFVPCSHNTKSYQCCKVRPNHVSIFRERQMRAVENDRRKNHPVLTRRGKNMLHQLDHILLSHAHILLNHTSVAK